MALPSTSSNKPHFSIAVGAGVVAAPDDAVNFLLDVAREDLSGYRRSGNDLLISFKDGRSLQISDFFLRGVGGHQLIAVQGDARWWVRLAPQTMGDGPVEASFEAVDDDSSSYLLGILGAGLGVGALAGAGSSGSQGSGSAPPPPEPSSPPGRPVIDAVSGQRTAPGEFLTGKATVEIQGHGAVANARLSVLVDGQLAGTAQADANGHWTYVLSGVSDGRHLITVTQTDAAGKTSEPADVNVVVDTTAPQAPQIDSVVDDVGSIQGLIAPHGRTDDSTPTLSGRAEAGSTIRIFDGSTQIGELVVGDDGQWQFTTPMLGDGLHILSVTATDAAGNESQPSETFELTVDTIAPAIPSIDRISDGAMGERVSFVTKDTQPTLEGRAEPHSTVTIYNGGKLLGSVTAYGDGLWRYAPDAALPDAVYQLTVQATDAAGNESQPSEKFALTVDTTAPPAPQIDSVVDDAGSIQGLIAPHGRTDDSTPTLSGRAEAGSTVRIFDGSTQIGELVVGDDGQWQFNSPMLGDGLHQLSVTATDAAGNESKSSETFEMTVDTIAPAIPGIDSINDGALGDRDFLVTKETQPTLKGRAEPHSTVTIYNAGKLLDSVTADGDGQWSYTPASALPDAVYQLTVQASDAAGNQSQPSEKFALTVDTTAPPAPQIDSVTDDAGSIQGPIAPGGRTDDRTPTLSGRAEAGSTIKIFDGSLLQIGKIVVGDDGQWQFTTPTLGDGLHTLSVTATDAAGNESQRSVVFELTVDTIAPAIPSIDRINDGALGDRGALVTRQAQPTLEGRAEPNSTVTIRIGDTEPVTVKADGNGRWSHGLEEALEDGRYALTVTAADAAGNASQPSAPFELTIDTIAPDAPSIDRVNDMVVDADFHFNPSQLQLTLQGQAEPYSTVTIQLGGWQPLIAFANAEGRWSFLLAQPLLADGRYPVFVTATDAAGNESPPSEFALNVDSIAPAIPSIDSIDDGALVGNDVLVTKEAQPTLKGRAEAHSTVTIQIGETDPVTVKADGNGQWSYRLEEALEDGNYTLTVTATDAAGNMGASSIPTVFTVDTTEPDQPWNIVAKNDIGNVTSNGEEIADTTPTFSGSAEANSVVYIFRGEDRIGSAEVGASGKWAWTPDVPWAEEVHTLKFQAVDAVGRQSPATEFTVKVIEPVLAITSIVDVYGRPLFDGSSTSTFNAMKVSGISTAAPYSTIIFQLENVPYATEVDENGQWTIQVFIDDRFEEGLHTLRVSVHSADGASTLTSLKLYIDSTMPAVAEIDTADGEKLSAQADLAATAIVGAEHGQGSASASADAVTQRWGGTADSRQPEGGILSAMADDDGGQALPASPDAGEEPLMLTAPDEAPMNDALSPGAVGHALLPVQRGSVEGLGESVDFGWLRPAAGGDPIDLAQLLSGAAAQTPAARPDAQGAAAGGQDSLPVAQGAVDNLASGEGMGRDAANLVFGADMRAPAADMGTELERLLAQQALTVV